MGKGPHNNDTFIFITSEYPENVTIFPGRIYRIFLFADPVVQNQTSIKY